MIHLIDFVHSSQSSAIRKNEQIWFQEHLTWAKLLHLQSLHSLELFKSIMDSKSLNQLYIISFLVSFIRKVIFFRLYV